MAQNKSLSTGDELVPPDKTPVNMPMLTALLREVGAEQVKYGLKPCCTKPSGMCRKAATR